jgi:hypothetical protein
MFDLKIFRTSLSDYAKTLSKLRLEIETTERAIEDVMFAPVSKDEAKAALRSWLRAQAGDYRKLLADYLSFAPKDPEAAISPEKLAENFRTKGILTLGASRMDVLQGRVESTPLQRAMCGLFEDAIWKAMEEALDSLPWEPNGLGAAERATKLATLRAKLAKLNDQENSMLRDVEELGIDVSAVK